MPKSIKFKDEQSDAVYPYPFLPIGYVFISVINTNPSTLGFAGTWEQITGDAYLKIVTTKGGQLGGTSSDHKIPIESMPSHNHYFGFNISKYEARGYGASAGGGFVDRIAVTMDNRTNNEGGGQSYYPYYYGVYIFVRTA